MKKINIFMSRLKYGGMELSLINFINNSGITDNYDVNLYLVYCQNNELIEKINKKVKIHLICKKKWNIYNKIKTAFKLLFLIILPPKSDISICYTNHQKVLSIITRLSSSQSVLFIHSDLNRYGNDKEKIKSKIKFNKFKKIVCVSEVVKESLIKLYDNDISKKCIVIPNYIDGKRVLELSKEKASYNFNYSIPTFVNIANHVEEYKNINLIINTAKKLKDESISFQIILIGSGKDSNLYKKLIETLDLQKEIHMLGTLSNPYPYLCQAKALLFTSKYEGYGMVLDEARVLHVPIISTGSGASKEICKLGYGIITNNLYKEMKNICSKKQINTKEFNYKEHNNRITEEYKGLFNSLE